MNTSTYIFTSKETDALWKLLAATMPVRGVSPKGKLARINKMKRKYNHKLPIYTLETLNLLPLQNENAKRVAKVKQYQVYDTLIKVMKSEHTKLSPTLLVGVNSLDHCLDQCAAGGNICTSFYVAKDGYLDIPTILGRVTCSLDPPIWLCDTNVKANIQAFIHENRKNFALITT